MTRDLFENRQNFHIRRITSDFLPYCSENIEDLRELILSEEDMYPGIDKWFDKKVINGISEARRVAYIGYLDNAPIVSAVVKSGKSAKFCHLKIAQEARNQSIGDIFFALMTLDVRKRADRIHFTLPEGLWESKKEFFSSFGFDSAMKSKTQYRKFEDELACNAPYSSVLQFAIDKLPKIASQFTIGDYSLDNQILLSVSPEYAELIMTGKKTVEIRRRFSARWAGTRMNIYATKPYGAIVGEAVIDNVIEDGPEVIWEKFGGQIACSKEEFDAYCFGADKVSALLLNDIRRFHSGISLEYIRRILGRKITPPQSFSNLAKNESWAQAVTVASILQGQVSKGVSPIIF